MTGMKKTRGVSRRKVLQGGAAGLAVGAGLMTSIVKSAPARAAGGKKASLASRDLARELTGCEIGAIPPFSFNPDLCLLVDPSLRERHEEIVFNAGRLDASILLNTEDYFRLAAPDEAPLTRA